MFILDHLPLWFFFLPFVLFELPLLNATGNNEDGKNKEGKGKILVLADALGTHYDFALNIVNILASEDYSVHFPVVRYDKSRKLTPPRDSSVKFIEIDFNNDDYDQHFGGKSPMKDFIGAQIEWNKSRLATNEVTKKFAELVKYNMFTYYKALSEYKYEGKQMFDWLRDQHYDLGIAEFCITSGPLAVFHRIGLKDYIVTSAAPPLPVTLYMLGQKLVADVPERFSAQKGDGNNATGIRNNNSPRREMNIVEYDNHIKEFTKVYNEDYKEMYNLVSNKKIKTQVRNEEMPPFGELLRRARFFLVNNHPLARFRVNVSKRIKFIGGLDVENAAISKGISKDMPLPEEYEWIKNEKCVVVFSMGTMIGFTGFTEKYVEALHSAISAHQQCKFLLRVNEQTAKHLQKLEKENGNIKIVVMPKFIPQKEILAQSNVRGFIYHCGQNTFNEVLYAEVPFICIPFFGDQFYNTAVAEYMGIGIWLEHEKFVEQFAEALNQLLGPPPLKRNAKKLEKVAHQENTKSAMKNIILSGQIANLVNSDPQIPKFLDIIQKVMREKKSNKRKECVFPAMERIKKDSQIEVDENPTAKFLEYFKPIFDKWWKENEKNGGEMKKGKEKLKN